VTPADATDQHYHRRQSRSGGNSFEWDGDMTNWANQQV